MFSEYLRLEDILQKSKGQFHCSCYVLRTWKSRQTGLFFFSPPGIPTSPIPQLHGNWFSLICISCGAAVLKAALVIQNWYRGYSTRLKARQRYALTIFQSIEYADEQGQLQVCFASSSLLLAKCFSLPLVIENTKKVGVHFKLRNLGENCNGGCSDTALEPAVRRGCDLGGRWCFSVLKSTF